MVSNRAVYLIRHAIAAERGADWPDDTRRPLTHQGSARMRQVVAGLKQLEIEVDVVLTSPLVRARQTAEIVVAGLKPTPAIAVLAALSPDGVRSGVIEALAEHPNAKGVALVGHEPALGILAAWLVGAHEPFAFKKGGVCRIDFSESPRAGRGELVWLATPAMLRALGQGKKK